MKGELSSYDWPRTRIKLPYAELDGNQRKYFDIDAVAERDMTWRTGPLDRWPGHDRARSRGS